jgi:ankyrin repeat protein
MRKDSVEFRSLLQKKADVNQPQADGTTALHWAIHWDDVAAAELLIRAGANVAAANRDQATPLFLASVNGNAALIEMLLKAGADANAPVLWHGETALMVAARTGKLDAVKALLDHGAQVNAKEDLHGTTALMWAAEQGHAAVLQLLIDRGAEVNAQAAVLPIRKRGRGFASETALKAAASGAAGKGSLPLKGALSPLVYAVREGAMDCVQILVKAGADVNGLSADGSSPLLVAVQNGFYQVAQFLLDRGAKPNAANNKGWTPLYLAVKNRNQEMTAIPGPSTDGVLEFIQTLLDRGADPNVRIKADTEVHQVMNSLWLKEAGATPLLRAALCGDLPVVRLLLDHHADASIPTFDKTTPLMVAAGVGWSDGMLRETSEEQTLAVVKLLLDLGADVNAANTHGITALHGAAHKGADKAVQLLVDHGAKLDAQDNGEDYGFGASSVRMMPINWAEGVPIGGASGIYHASTVALLTRMMNEKGIPIVSNAFHAKKPDSYTFGGLGDTTK